ncbi:angiopoietin-2 [Episyrphus balteatus]|uniref:angiopoietin-2 n=1 Tax=Episyrphus balteatus TaxID=286459 RepID=UPI002485758F|nr:angiopoietin-2 [Episyrphus balteatus]
MTRTIWFLILLSLLVKVFPLTVPETTEGEPSLDAETTFSSHYLNSLDHKMENMIKTLSAVDTSIKQLQEKAHTWAIFHHHIDSWNDQMKTIEHKIDLIKRTQDENQIINQKLVSQEFTLNHILSKLVFLSDSSYNRGENENIILRNGENGFGEIKKLINGDRKMRNEIGTRLSNILRHVQNIERDSCRGCSKSNSNNGNEPKMAKLIHPIMTCNGSRSNNKVDLKDIDKKLNQLIETIPQNVIAKIIENDQKNTDRWLLTSQYFDKLNDRSIEMKEVNAEHYLKLSNLCQSMSNEITTFTGSSDLLLKKFEKLVIDVQKKVDKLAEREDIEKRTDSVGTDTVKPKTDEENDSNGSEENFDIDGETQNGSKKSTEDVEEIDNNSRESEEPQEEINFVQPLKNGCHELTKRVDGIYKFSTSKTNAALRDMNEQYCVFSTDGPAWTVIQNRGPYAIQENFNRSWNEYRDGFGSLEKDFWMGNEFLHQLTYADNYELRIELEDFEGIKAWVEYSTFRINAERYNYNLIIDGYRGAIPDALSYHNEHDFSTYDSRNDKSVDACCACATGYASGWWFNNCAEANLNGVFHNTPLGHNYVGIVWDQWHGDYSLRSSKMMLRPKVWPKEREEETYNGSSEDP